MAFDDFGEPTAGDHGWAALAHAGGLLLNPLVALVVLAARGRHSPYTRAHALEAANFHLTVLLGVALSFMLLATFAAPAPLVVVVAGWALSIAAAVRAAQGREWRYPMSLRVLRAQPVPGGDPDDARVVLGTTREGTRVATGASGPGDAGYDGRVGVGDEGGATDG